eukprot:Lithocolla_globosa_v1_NODE_3807_length_1574_cov_63.998683.p1 type:complete len:231 gc:universal NODE_3807_length_1574_cov_63.998683:770-1462(+)
MKNVLQQCLWKILETMKRGLKEAVEPPKKRYEVNRDDSEVAILRRSLHHVERDPNFKGSWADAKGVPRQLTSEQQEAITRSEQAAFQHEGKIKAVDPSLLTGLLRFYKGDVKAKKLALSYFFGQWSSEDLASLLTIIESGNKNLASESGSESDHEKGRDVIGDAGSPRNPFLAHSQAWIDVASSHGSLFLNLLKEEIALKTTGQARFDKEAAWAVLLNEYITTRDQKPED